MKNFQHRRYGPGCLSKFLLLDLLLDKNVQPIFLYTGSIVLIGAMLYHWLEGWSWLDSFYFVIITLTTIGYGDLSPTTPLARLITIFYAVNGIAILLMLLDEIRRVRAHQIYEHQEFRAILIIKSGN